MEQVQEKISRTRFTFAKKAHGTKHWLRMLMVRNAELKDEIENHWKEC